MVLNCCDCGVCQGNRLALCSFRKDGWRFVSEIFAIRTGANRQRVDEIARLQFTDLRNHSREQRVAPTALLRDKFITDAVNGEQMLRLTAVVAKFFPELHDDLIQRARGAVIITAPDFVQ